MFLSQGILIRRAAATIIYPCVSEEYFKWLHYTCLFNCAQLKCYNTEMFCIMYSQVKRKQRTKPPHIIWNWIFTESSNIL